MPRAGLLLLPLLLCFGPETAGSIDPAALKAIVDHIHQYQPQYVVNYAVAMSLPWSMCKEASSSELQRHLPVTELKDMKSQLEKGTLFEGDHIVAAKPDKSASPPEHPEWQMFKLDQNGVSPISRLLDKTRRQSQCPETTALGEEHGSNRYTNWYQSNPCRWDRCFIYFTNFSPCLGTCLSLKKDHCIQQLMDGIFGGIDKDLRALAFKKLYKEAIPDGKQFIWNSWQTLCKVPFYKCNDQDCHSCAEKDVNTNLCLKEEKTQPRPDHAG
ncbi:uncharacterized protein LOC142025230 isoform X2 [Carettochelys insculpta]